MDLTILLGLAVVLLVVPGRVDRWALERGASPTTLTARWPASHSPAWRRSPSRS
jgi:hypothetical protein